MDNRNLRKGTLYLLFFVFTLSLFTIGIKAKAADVPTTEFYPDGINYIDPSNIIYRPGANYNLCSIETSIKIKVKPSTEYAFYFSKENEGEILGFTVTGYNTNGKFEDTIETISFGECSNRKFTVPSNIQYIKFTAQIQKDFGTNFSLSDVAHNYFLVEYEEGQELDFTTTDLQYHGPDYEDYMIAGKSITYSVYMSNPISFESIDKMVYVFDKCDGNITNKKVVTKNEYQSATKAGNYAIDYEATDNNGNTANFTIDVKLIDDIAPVFSGDQSYVYTQLENKTLNDIISGITVLDNNDGDLTDLITVETDEYTGNETTPGNYAVVLSSEDEAGNVSTYDLDIEVYYFDVEAPVITGQTEYVIKDTETLSIATIISNLEVTDNLDGDLSEELLISYNSLTNNLGKIGTYLVTLKVSDQAGNTTTQDITVKIVDGMKPIFMFNSKNVYLELDEAMVGTEEIVVYLQKTHNMPSDVEYKVLYDEYSENKNTPGQYRVIYQYGDSEARVLVNVVEDLYDVEEEMNFIEKIILFFKNLFTIIGEFFRRLFS